jgi:tRNA threonylcarbamoyladenosine dehydratase
MDTLVRIPAVDPRFLGVERLYGPGSVERLSRAHVAIVGIGGVGSWAVEALARSGIGRLTLLDADDVCVSNSNRQLHALDGQFGRPKVIAMAERAVAINPALKIDAIADFVTVDSLVQHMDRGYDCVLDACDSLRVKVDMIAFCKRRKIPIVVCGSAGARRDPTRIVVRDLARTEQDALLALVRRKLRDDYAWSRNRKAHFSVPAVFSRENVRYPPTGAEVCEPAAPGLKLDCSAGLGAVAHVTGAFGLVAVSRVIERILAAELKLAAKE